MKLDPIRDKLILNGNASIQRFNITEYYLRSCSLASIAVGRMASEATIYNHTILQYDRRRFSLQNADANKSLTPLPCRDERREGIARDVFTFVRA